MKFTYLDVDCANQDCENRMGEGAFVLLRHRFRAGTSSARPFTLLMCGPCATAFAESCNA